MFKTYIFLVIHNYFAPKWNGFVQRKEYFELINIDGAGDAIYLKISKGYYFLL